jgi:uncharacterized protein involved in exopolysaccharide biosynthesis
MERNHGRVWSRVWLTAGFTVAVVALTSALAGDLDPTFNGTGKVLPGRQPRPEFGADGKVITTL